MGCYFSAPPVEYDKTANTFITPEQLFEKSYNKGINDIIKRARISIAYAEKHGNLNATFAIPNTGTDDKHYKDAMEILKKEGWEVYGVYSYLAGINVKPLRYEKEWDYQRYGRGIYVKLTPSKKIQDTEQKFTYFYKPPIVDAVEIFYKPYC
jgi:hypothetical protein